ncbi:MAG: hypothetical protein AAGJ34_13675 [Pseudomonadota bacterium]
MSSWKQTKDHEARVDTLFLWLKIFAVALFFGTAFLLGVNPFTGALLEGTETLAPSEQHVS